jgi:hypothetical protein
MEIALRGEIKQAIDGLWVELHREMRNLVFAMVAANSTLVGLAFAAAKLL